MNRISKRLLALIVLLGMGLFVAAIPARGAAPDDVNPIEEAAWIRQLPTVNCPFGGDDCHRASPALADINNDGVLDIVVATNGGHILALTDDGSPDGRVLWDVNIGPYIGASASNTWISSSPAVGDIDNNDGGRPEIVVGFGFELSSSTPGGIIVLEHNGTVKPGWPKMSIGTHSNGVPISVVSSPAIGDLDNDGDMEIVYGGLDKRVYAYHHNGTLLPGFPPDSALAQRFPTWPNLRGRLADTIWGSPALADLNGDGYLDIIIGTDEGNFDDRYGGNSGGWVCPYELPAGWAPGYCGGSLYAFNRHGNLMPGFPRYILEIVQSSPATADINGDGRAEVFVGTGAFYRNFSPDNPTYGFRLFGFTPTGNYLPGWSGGKSLNETSPATPSIGNIAGDSEPEIIIGDNAGYLWAFHINGSTVPGFPKMPRTRLGNTTPFDVGKNFLLGDYDGDNLMEIIIAQGESITVIDGDGTQLTTRDNGQDGKPAYATAGYLMNSPALGDVDGDGKLELVAHDSRLFVWDLPNHSTRADWGQFKHNSLGDSYYPAPGRLGSVGDTVVILQDDDSGVHFGGQLTLTNTGDRSIDWEIDPDSLASGVTVNFTSGTLRGHHTETVTFSITNGSSYNLGWHNLGFTDITTLDEWGDPAGNATVSLSLHVTPLQSVYLPVVADQ